MDSADKREAAPPAAGTKAAKPPKAEVPKDEKPAERKKETRSASEALKAAASATVETDNKKWTPKGYA